MKRERKARRPLHKSHGKKRANRAWPLGNGDNDAWLRYATRQGPNNGGIDDTRRITLSLLKGHRSKHKAFSYLTALMIERNYISGMGGYCSRLLYKVRGHQHITFIIIKTFFHATLNTLKNANYLNQLFLVQIQYSLLQIQSSYCPKSIQS